MINKLCVNKIFGLRSDLVAIQKMLNVSVAIIYLIRWPKNLTSGGSTDGYKYALITQIIYCDDQFMRGHINSAASKGLVVVVPIKVTCRYTSLSLA